MYSRRISSKKQGQEEVNNEDEGSAGSKQGQEEAYIHTQKVYEGVEDGELEQEDLVREIQEQELELELDNEGR